MHDKQGGEAHHHGLSRVLTVRDLTFFGIAAIIGAGSFSSLGGAVHSGGPGVVVLFIICGIACGFTAFCYAEFASRIPVAGSAYTYAYASFGELFAWIIGWALLMEYSIGNIYVAFSWSDYFTSLLSKLNVHIPDYFTTSYHEARIAIEAGTANEELRNAWTSAPVIGGLRMIDNGEVDDKIIAVLKDDAIYGRFEDIEDCPPKILARLKHYFLTYKEIPGEGGERKVSIEAMYNRKEAQHIINLSAQDYDAAFPFPR